MFNLQFNYLSFLIKDLKCRIIGVDSFLSDKLVKTDVLCIQNTKLFSDMCITKDYLSKIVFK